MLTQKRRGKPMSFRVFSTSKTIVKLTQYVIEHKTLKEIARIYCMNKTLIKKALIKHGLQITPIPHYVKNTRTNRIYNIYLAIIHRCYIKTNPYYKKYGHLGIRVSNEFKNDFKVFANYLINDLGFLLDSTIIQQKLSRLDITKNYERGNLIITNKKIRRKLQKINKEVSDGINYHKPDHNF